ncbi:MAG: hypothetical protein LLF76_03215 [Planctomycetaceae bacterium]|nr:hypothetical protein [Planctomycetaceae bacterium]
MLPGRGVYIGQSDLADAPYHKDNGRQVMMYSDGDVWNEADRCYYYYVPLKGDGQMCCRIIELTNQWINPQDHELRPDLWTKAGLMIRQSLEPQSAQFDINITPMMNPDGTPGLGQFQLQCRPSIGNPSYMVVQNETGVDVGKNTWLKITKRGNSLRGYRSFDGGTTWTEFGSVELKLSEEAYIGLFLAGAPGMSANAIFDNVAFSNSID